MPITTLLRSFFFTALIAAVPAAWAADEIRAQDFVDQASAAGVAEIESARMALQKSQAPEVHNFAEQMIKDHTKANEDLKELAMNKQLEVASEADLMNKAKAMILEMREGESFDQAYANNQVKAHEQVIELFTRASQGSTDSDVQKFAEDRLPELKEHLEMAKKLVTGN